MSLPSSRVAHVFSVDVEEYFQVNAFDGAISPASWGGFDSRVDASTDALLDLLARTGSRGTFFVLGWVAERRPALVRRIVDAGHEVASHGWWHRRVNTTTPDAFRSDVRDSKALLEDVAGAPVLGYRAPSFSITPGFEWAFDVLLEEGYTYDSSLFPIRRPGYGYAAASPLPHRIRRPAGELVELPLATTPFAGARLPAAGGGWFRQLPYALTRRAFREHDAAGRGAMFYIHPWEVDPGQPRLPASWLTRVRHYRGLDRTLARLERLTSEFRFVTARERLAASDLPWNASVAPAGTSSPTARSAAGSAA